MVLSYVALGVIAFLIVMIAAIIVQLGSLPGKIAHRRGHPQADAVNAASWISFVSTPAAAPPAPDLAHHVRRPYNDAPPDAAVATGA